MNIDPHSIRLLQRAVHLWLFGYLISAFSASEELWEYPLIPPLPAPAGLLSSFTHAFGVLDSQPLVHAAVLLLLVLALRGVFARSHWWITLIEWILFSSLVNQAWLASTGGHQLIANVLFWMIFLPGTASEDIPDKYGPLRIMRLSAFWIIRLQLLLAYAVTGIQKLNGSLWPSGHAVGVVATDGDYGPVWVASLPMLAVVLNYAVLCFQLTFPLAVWWSPTRRWWMWIGVLFHVGTGLAFGIMDMGLAFLAVYPIWFSDRGLTWSQARPQDHGGKALLRGHAQRGSMEA